MQRIIFFIPPLRTMSGGLANIYAVARHLAELGRSVALMTPSRDAAGFADALAEGLEALPWGSALRASDTWCIPEGWPNAIPAGLEAKARVLVYVQNWVYMLGNLPQGVRWQQLPLEYLAVSGPVAWFMREIFGLAVRDCLPPVIEDVFFQGGKRPSGHVRIAWMPRKNKALGEQIRQVAAAWLAERPDSPRVEWVAIHKLSRPEVAAILSTCHLFISTGFPEGFGLPPLEAMASGCVPVGFTGFGGWEYMRQSRLGGVLPEGIPPHGPPFILPSTPADTTGNGFFFADGDTLGAGLGLARAVYFAHNRGEGWEALTQSCRKSAARYTAAVQKGILARLFSL